MLALVNDSGVGKTSLVCSFAASLGAVVPVVLVQARDLVFGTEDALAAHVIHSLQGVLEPAERVVEESALAHHLVGMMPLTLIVDGLDEARDARMVQMAITSWLRSRLGQTGILIVTSRPEFWRMCSDESWKQWMPDAAPDDRVPMRVADDSSEKTSEPASELRLPDRFTERELEVAWERAGHDRVQLYGLAPEARQELRHPFTLRVYSDLCMQESLPSSLFRRADLLERWLNRRLDLEAVSLPAERITCEMFQQALRQIATRIAASKGGSVSVDDLVRVPRFDSVNPPGKVVQRLIEANILESVPGQPDRIRFSVEAVQDFYRAGADLQNIKDDPLAIAQRFSELRFSDAYPRLTRIGSRLASDEVRHAFVDRLADTDPRMAAIVLRPAPSQYNAELRAKVAKILAQQIGDRHRVRAAFAITMLGEVNCQEAAAALAGSVLPPADLHPCLRGVAAEAFAKLSYAPAAEFVYQWRILVWSGNETYYFREQLSMLRRAKPEFLRALADHAVTKLDASSGTPEHAKAVSLSPMQATSALSNIFAEGWQKMGCFKVMKTMPSWHLELMPPAHFSFGPFGL